MAILSKINFIHIELPLYAVTEIHGIDIDTNKEIRLKANEQQDRVFYLHESKTNKNIIIQQIKIGQEKIDSFFVENPNDPTKNLLIEMERELTGEP